MIPGARRLREYVLHAAGGPARARVVLTLAAVLGLEGADTGTISATTGNLERAFHVGNTDIGLLLSVVSLTGVLFTLPFGVLADRTRRTRLLSISITAWSVATLFSGAAPSYLWLLLARVALGMVTAAAGPVVASLTGDYFPAAERGRMYGLILGGEIAGTGLGFVISGDISTVLSWRYAMWWLVLPSLALAWLVHKLPEPARGGQGQITEGATRIPDESGTPAPSSPSRAGEHGTDRPHGIDRPHGADPAEEAVRHAHIQPQAALVLHSDPTRQSLWWAIRYVLRVRTNVIIIVASALGYFYFAGLRSFAIIYATRHYGLGKPVANLLLLVVGAGALAGVFLGGRISDRLLRRGHVNARILVPAICLLAIAPVLAPAIATTSVVLALPLLTFGAVLLGAPNPPLDAARLDIIPPQLWGRAEAVRSVLRTLGEAGAPTLFGYMSQYVFGGPAASGSAGGAVSSTGTASASGATGLGYT
ncbi:MAG: MFS transporter, partial [Pseudonocardiales bacterium]